ncbi:MAG TPA: hypothetical protein VKZ99_05145 [Gammaproteobacteria bacterium]|nr:hypothetical protein [Gammaproteobacteria bacterium]
MKSIVRFVLVSAALLPAAALADGFNVSGRIGTLGLGAELGYAFNDYVNVRLALNNYSYSYDTTEDGIEYDFDLELESKALFLDIHPFAGAFRITGGILDNKNRLEGQAVPMGEYEIGDQTYTGAEVGTLYSNVGLGESNPVYVGLGWSKALGRSGFGVGFDLGVVLQGSPTVRLFADGPITENPATAAEFEANLRAEEEDLQSELSNFETYPVISIGLTYQF